MLASFFFSRYRAGWHTRGGMVVASGFYQVIKYFHLKNLIDPLKLRFAGVMASLL